jgi:hypothetical protein
MFNVLSFEQIAMLTFALIVNQTTSKLIRGTLGYPYRRRASAIYCGIF